MARTLTRSGHYDPDQPRAADGRWVTVSSAILKRGGRFRVALTQTGLYRVRSGDAASPAVRVRG